MLFLGLCLLGALSLTRLPVQLLPDIEFPSLTVVTPYEGAPPSEIEQLVTRRVEEAAGSVSGVREIRSESLEGLSLVTLRFNWKTDMDFSLIETREKVDMIKGELPENAGRSIVVKYDPSQDPMIICAVEAVNDDFKKLRKRVEREIIPRLERAGGTAHIDLNGGYRRQINVHLDTGSLYARGISIAEVVDAIGAANFNFPAGTIVKGSREYAVRTIGEFASVGDIGRVVVARADGGAPVYLEDAGEVEDGYREQKCLIRLDGKDALGLLIYKEPGKNTIAACAAAREMIAGLSEKYGGELSMRIIYDQSVFVSSAVNNVLMAALLGGLFAVLTLWFFLGDSRSALIIAASIPISVLGSFALMHFSGLTINVMSLGGLALGTGMMVDAGIVVLESIARKKQEAGNAAGPGLIRLIAEGVREVRTPVIASTATTLVVFLPILFISGVAGALFGQLALTISFSLVCSLLTSLALVPMLSGLPVSKKTGGASPGFLAQGHAFMVKAADNLLERLSSMYDIVLRRAFDNPGTVVICGALMVLLGTGVTALLDRELMPGVDSGEFTLEVHSSPGTPLEEQSRLCAAMETALLRSPHVRHVYAKIGSDPDENISERLLGKQSNYAKLRVILKDGRRPHIRDIIAGLKESVRAGELVRLDFRVREDVVESVISSGSAPLSIELRDNDLERLRSAGDTLKKALGSLAGIRNISSGLDRGGPELKLIIDRARMQSLEVDAAAVASSVRAAVHGETATAFRLGDDETDVLVRLRETDRSGIDSLNAVMVKSRRGVLLPVGKFVSIEEGYGAARITRCNQSRVNIISADIDGSRKGAQGRAASLLDDFTRRESVDARMAGGFTELAKTLPEMAFAALLAIVLVYMVLASQFQSMMSPLVIMCSIPLTLLGSAGALLAAGKTLNINSGIGIILLCGTVVNNAIVLVDYADRMRNEGHPLRQALLLASGRRLRPIMMTTLTTILGMLPIALGLGKGSEIQQPLAIAVIGGLMTSTFLTLLFIPSIYFMLLGGRETGR